MICDVDIGNLLAIRSGRKNFTLVKVSNIHVAEKMLFVMELEEDDDLWTEPEDEDDGVTGKDSIIH